MTAKCILNCRDATRFFGFPHACPRRMKLWADNLGLDVSLMTQKRKICEHHFDPKHIGKKHLLLDAVPEKRLFKSSVPQTSAATTSRAEGNLDDTRFETIYLTDKSNTARTYGNKPSAAPQVHIQSNTHDTQQPTKEYNIPAQNSSEIDGNSSDECASLLEPLGTRFNGPPKRTYGQSNNSYAKTPKLDITATCYCRCHKGEDEKIRLKHTIDEMKIRVAEQSREINLLISKNKVSEHLLKGKVKKITELMNLESSLRKAIEGLNIRISIMNKRQIRAAPNASENSIVLARMICDRRKKYTKSEVIVANKLYAISGRCYYFMRDVLKLNLPHPTTLLRNRNIVSDVPEEHAIYIDFNGDPIQEEQQEEPIVFSPEPIEEQHEEELLDVDV